MQSYLTNLIMSKQFKEKHNVDFNILAEYVFGKQFVYSRSYGAGVEQAIALSNHAVSRIPNTCRTENFYKNLAGKTSTVYSSLVSCLSGANTTEIDIDIEVNKIKEVLSETVIQELESELAVRKSELTALRKDTETLLKYKNGVVNFILVGEVVTH